jgi:hypothetical protein
LCKLLRLERAQTAPAQALLARHHLSFDPAMHDEGYIIVPDGEGGLAVIAETSENVFIASYGLAFHRDPTGKISQAQRELMAVHAAFQQTGTLPTASGAGLPEAGKQLPGAGK